ncbi:MAG: HigA family addiction module antidote protein [Alphaproteobacteria bacterium]|jgi:addiction module HigA family antidote|nr:HigA family addiction module antidote protein [Alphaproteobacteria bacterium]
MAIASSQFRPDYAVPPGWVVEERLEVQGLSHAEFARRCGRSPKLISEIIAGKAPLEPETALQFEKVLGVDASIWLGIEADYQLHRARQTEAASAAGSGAWLRRFPIRELVKRGIIPQTESDADAVSKLLSFFRVGSVEAWRVKYASANVAYRHSPSFKSDEAALATWLRLGELEAERQACAAYNETRFRQALREIRALTRAPIEEALSRARQLCNQSGVGLALIKPLPKTALSGAAWWITPKKAVIQLSARHKSDDHLWFSFFHEAAHILLHSKKNVFIDDMSDGNSDLEVEANEWASNMLVQRSQWKRFAESFPRSEQAVCAFADEQGLAPGIIVGMLQHEGHLPWTHLNGLKARYRWPDN